MKKFVSIIVVANFLLVSGLIVFLCTKPSNTKVAYIEVGKVYAEFKLSKELERKYTDVVNRRKTFLDSLELNLRSLYADKNEESEFIAKREEYYRIKTQYDEDNKAMSAKYNEQVATQMNQFLLEYGKDKNFDFVFGANGSGSLVYANSNAYDVTADVIAYVNRKYSGI